MKKGRINVKTVICMAIGCAVIIAGAYVLLAAKEKLTHDTFPLKYESEVNAASEKYNVEKALIYAVIKTESNFDPAAKSVAGAMGLMQIMPDTFTWLNSYYVKDDSHKTEDLYDPKINIEYGTQLLSILLEKYGVEDTALCAYNGGVGNVDEWLKDPEYSDDGKTLKAVPFGETDNYRKKVARNKSVYIELYFKDDD